MKYFSFITIMVLFVVSTVQASPLYYSAEGHLVAFDSDNLDNRIVYDVSGWVEFENEIYNDGVEYYANVTAFDLLIDGQAFSGNSGKYREPIPIDDNLFTISGDGFSITYWGGGPDPFAYTNSFPDEWYMSGYYGITFDEFDLPDNYQWAYRESQNYLQLSKTAPVPEPSMIMLLCVGLAAVAGKRKFSKSN